MELQILIHVVDKLEDIGDDSWYYTLQLLIAQHALQTDTKGHAMSMGLYTYTLQQTSGV